LSSQRLSLARRALALASVLLAAASGTASPAVAQDHHVYYIANDHSEIRRAEMDGSDDQLVLTIGSPTLAHLGVSPDGRRIAYDVSTGFATYGIFVARSDGHSPAKVADAAWTVAAFWPGDSDVAYNHADGSGGGGSSYYRVPAEGGTPSLWLRPDPYGAHGLNTFRSPLRWSADGARYATTVGSGGGAGNTVFAGDIDLAAGVVSNVRRLSPAGSGSWGGGVALDAEISRDGQTVFYVWRDESVDRAELRRIGFDGTNEQVLRVTSAANPVGWLRASPDGERLFFVSRGSAGDPQAIASIRLDGTDYRQHVTAARSLGQFDFGLRVDDQPPVIEEVRADPAVLWPPNHKMLPVEVTVVAHDAIDAAPTCEITSVLSSEPDGTEDVDWVLTSALTLELRAERFGGNAGRLYTITVECRDDRANAATATVVVAVPHDQGK
jgi:hypothetical protein